MCGNSEITEVHELKNIYITLITVFRITFRFHECRFKIFTCITLNPRGRTRLIFKRNAKKKEWNRFTLLWFQKETTRKSKTISFIRNKFILTGLYNSEVFCNYKKLIPYFHYIDRFLQYTENCPLENCPPGRFPPTLP